MSDVSHILNAIDAGDSNAASALFPLVYDELRQIAAAKMAQERPGQTLDATALVHEAYLRLAGNQSFDNRRHFFAAAAEAMRRILVENGRRKKSVKHGGGLRRTELVESDRAIPPVSLDVLALDEALRRLAEDDPCAARLVEMHYFAGFSIEEAADILGISRAKAYRDWMYARAWLLNALGNP